MYIYHEAQGKECLLTLFLQVSLDVTQDSHAHFF